MAKWEISIPKLYLENEVDHLFEVELVIVALGIDCMPPLHGSPLSTPAIVLFLCMFCPMALISKKRLTWQPRRDNMIGLKVLAITIIVTALISSVVGGALVSVTVQSSIDQRLQAQRTPNPTIDPQAYTQSR